MENLAKGGILTSVTLLFLFSGFYKELIYSPLDLTVLTAILTYLAILFCWKESVKLIRSSIFILIIVLTGWLALRLFPSMPAWGVRKIQEIAFFGPAAIGAGYLIAKDRRAMDTLLLVLSYAAIPMAFYVAVSAALGNPYSFQWIGSSGYQGTGLIFGLSVIASTVSKRSICFGFSTLGCGVTGHLSGTLFSAAAVFLLWVIYRDWRTIGKSILASVLLITIYTFTVAPPLIFMRIMWKSGAILIKTTSDQRIETAESENYLVNQSRLGKAIVTGLKAMPDESQKYQVDAISIERHELYHFAINQFRIRPIVGHGYGAIDYLGNKYPHNIVLEILSETGIIGGFLMMTILYLTALSFWKMDVTETKMFSLGCFILLIFTAMVSGYWGGRILFFGIGLSVGARRNY
jgi:hypothetical protein